VTTATPVRGWQVPDEFQDPYYDDILALFMAIDAWTATAVATSGNVVNYLNGATLIARDTLASGFISAGSLMRRSPAANLTATSGTQKAWVFDGTFAPATGSPLQVLMSLEPTIDSLGDSGASVEALRIALTETLVPGTNYAVRVLGGPDADDDRFYLYADGRVRAANGSKQAPSYAFMADDNTGFFAIEGNTGRFYLSLNGGVSVTWGGNQQMMDPTTPIGWASQSIDTATIRSADVQIIRDGPNVLAQRRQPTFAGDGWQAFRLYNVYDVDGVDYERLHLGWDDSNNAYVRTQAGGTGTARALYVGPEGEAALHLVSFGSSRWQITEDGHLVAELAGLTIGDGTVLGDPATVYAREQFVLSGNNGQALGVKILDDLVSVANGVTAQLSTIQLPAGAMLVAIDARVTVALPSVTAYSACLDDDSSGSNPSRFGAAASGTVGSSIKGSKGMPYVDSAGAHEIQFLFTGTTSANTGRIRLTIWYLEVTGAAS
jgi:hypothetical protein